MLPVTQTESDLFPALGSVTPSILGRPALTPARLREEATEKWEGIFFSWPAFGYCTGQGLG